MNILNLEKRVILLDPAAGTANLGDQIISEAVQDTINEVSNGQARIVSVSVHQIPSKAQLELMSAADLVVAGGSNLINFRYWPFRDGRWNNSYAALSSLKNVLLFGVGSSAREDRSNFLGKFLYPKILHKSLKHSVRDEFTAQVMRGYGFDNVVNTVCPTMWKLNDQHMRLVASKKAPKVVFTLTDYHKDPESDRAMISLLGELYEQVYFWPQGFFDLQYFHDLDVGVEVSIIPPRLAAYDEVLSKLDIDYIGTRLHAGIRALQKSRRAIILSIDNRAEEISRDTGLVTLSRGDIGLLRDLLKRNFAAKLSLPTDEIEKWKNQLKGVLHG